MISVVSSKILPKVRLDLLQDHGSLHNPSVGGRFILPDEFDSGMYASRFAAKGNQLAVSQGREMILGSTLSADGWQVWKFPDTVGRPLGSRIETPEVNSPSVPDNKVTKSKTSKTAESKISKPKKVKTKQVHELVEGQAHPLAGMPHEIPGDKAGEVYVLLFRPLAIQEQVNAAYGEVSRKAMVNETLGLSMDQEVAVPGMISNQTLNRLPGQRDMAAEREFDEHQFGSSKAIGVPVVQSGEHRIQRPAVVVHH